ncbi:serine/threonine-protein kinase [Mycoplasma corogypsi]|uniref:serine/threonine-protein kinase n=1 Tax=Mycoplasma corogypsi TaxID=2106 RepID=UPI003873820E
MSTSAKINTVIKENSRIWQKYNVIRQIGGGGMGMVYEVRLKANPNISYALKYYISNGNDSNKRRFDSEVNLLKQIKSQYVPKVFEYYANEDERYYVMEYIKGITLEDHIRTHGYLNTKQLVFYAKQLASVVEEIHNLNIIHRDIKSSNIIVSDSSKIYLIDFGISLSDDSQRYTKTNAVICSPYYTAPETIQKGGVITHLVDIYAIGIVLFEMCVGRYPFEGKDAKATLFMHSNETFPDPRKFRKMSSALANIIIKCTAKNPQQRYQTVREIIDDLNVCLDSNRWFDAPISTKTLKPKQSLPEFVNSNKWLYIVMGLVVIIIFALIIVLLIKPW